MKSNTRIQTTIVNYSTRLAVDFLLGLFAAGWTQEQVLASYPQLPPDGLRAVFAYAAEVTQDEALHVVRRGVA